MNALARSCLGLALAGLLLVAVHAAGSEILAGADLALGERLISEHACAECHSRHVGGDGSAIYRPQGRISTPGALHIMVQYCSSQLNLSLFPEEITAIAAVLQRDHYHFK